MFWKRAARATLLLALVSASGSALAGSRSMTLGEPAKRPIGHYLFCQNHPDACRKQDGPERGPAELTPELIREVAAINTRTNTEVHPLSDLRHYGVAERWTYPDGSGDCEDYALLKQKRLEAAGIPLSDLLMTVVKKASGEGHAVLTLRTRAGDFVLDNLDWRIKNWSDTAYIFVKRQSSSDPRYWVSVAEGTDAPVGALTK